MVAGKPSTRADKDPDVLAFGTLLSTYRSVERVLKAELKRRSGMSHTWFDALIRIALTPEKVITMGELSALTSLSSGGMTRLIDRLVEAGYVERRGSPSDRRVQFAALTASGAKALDAAALVHSANIREHFTGKLSPKELETFLTMLDRIRTDGSASCGGG